MFTMESYRNNKWVPVRRHAKPNGLVRKYIFDLIENKIIKQYQ